MTSRVVPLIALVLAGAILFAYALPTYNGSIAATKASIDGADKALAAASVYQAQEKVLTDAKNQIPQSNLDHLATFLPDSVSNVQIILDLNALAARSGVQLSGIDVQQAQSSSVDTNTGPTGSIDLSLSVAGSYTAFRNFLSGIENSARLLDVTHLSVRSSETGVYTYSMTLRLYWLR